ncbi:MAG: dihydroorotase [Elusimicrobiales bacterium]|jgi:dihydroorotase
MSKLLIQNALVIDPALKLEKKMNLLIEDGRIKSVGSGFPGTACGSFEIYDASGLWLMPGLIDMHVHTREPGMERAENLSSASQAAAAGGFTSILAMPNTDPPADDPELLLRLRAKAAALPVNIYFSGAVSRGRAGLKLADLKALRAAGALAFTDDGACVSDPELLKKALEFSRTEAVPVLEHAENPALAGQGVIHQGKVSAALGLPGILDDSESSIVLRDVKLARETGGRLHFQHLSCRESVEIVREAKKLGSGVTAETCPHYFTLTCEDVKDASYKMKPPLRESEDLAALKEGLADGAIDVIASDHAPHPAAEKAKGLLKAPFGVIGLETALGLALTELFHTGLVSRLRLAELLSSNPARILGLKSKGGLAPGMDADLTLIDPAVEYYVGPRFYSRSVNSPFIGRRLKGRAAATIVGGRFVFSRAACFL